MDPQRVGLIAHGSVYILFGFDEEFLTQGKNLIDAPNKKK